MTRLVGSIQPLSSASTELARWQQWSNHGAEMQVTPRSHRNLSLPPQRAQPVSTTDECCLQCGAFP